MFLQSSLPVGHIIAQPSRSEGPCNAHVAATELANTSGNSKSLQRTSLIMIVVPTQLDALQQFKKTSELGGAASALKAEQASGGSCTGAFLCVSRTCHNRGREVKIAHAPIVAQLMEARWQRCMCEV
jgi:hypothetical protein